MNSLSKHPKVSVIMPFYRQDQYLLDAAICVEDQTYQNFELIVVDDCSTEQSAHDILAWRRMEQLKIIRLEQNGGVSEARNIAVAESSGELILPLDSDDLITSDYLEKAVAVLLQDQSAAGVFTAVRIFEGDGKHWIWHPTASMPELLSQDWPNTFLYRKEIFNKIGGYDRNLRRYEDWDFMIRCLEAGFRFSQIQEALYHYRKHAGGVTASKDYSVKAQLLTTSYRELSERYLEDLLTQQVRLYETSVKAYQQIYDYYQTHIAGDQSAIHGKNGSL
jgi:glycosyltransferase involved in cell wall biosynthesis